MNTLLRAEARKIRSTRSVLALAGLAALYPLTGIVHASLASEPPPVDAGTILAVLRSGADVLMLAALVLGAVAATGEHRHGTIVPALLAAPRRGRFLVAKLGSQAVLAAAVAGAAAAVALGAGSWYLAGRGVGVDVLSAGVLGTVAAAVLAAVVYAVYGVAVGTLVRNQTAAVAGLLVWFFAIERALPFAVGRPDLADWLPGGAATRLLHAADPGAAGPWGSIAFLAGSAAVLFAAAAAWFRTADVG